MASLMEVSEVEAVEGVLRERWRFAQTYSLASGGTAEERQPYW